MDNDKAFERVIVDAGDYLFEEGNPGTAAYLIIAGEVEIRAGARSEAPRRIARLGKGEIVGEMSLFDSSPRMASGIAVTKVEALRISRFAFRSRLNDLDAVMKGVIMMMVKRMRGISKENADLKRHDWRPG